MMEPDEPQLEIIEWFYTNGYLSGKGKDYYIDRLMGDNSTQTKLA